MKYTAFHERRFRTQVNKALGSVKKILDSSRNPRLASEYDKDHTYDDKFALAELLTSTALVAQVNILEQWGLQAEQLKQMLQWVNDEKKTATLRFEAKQTCEFLQEKEVPVVKVSSKLEKKIVEKQGGTVVLGSAVDWLRNHDPKLDEIKESTAKAFSVLTGLPMPKDWSSYTNKKFVEDAIDWLRNNEPNLDQVDEASVEEVSRIAGIVASAAAAEKTITVQHKETTIVKEYHWKATVAHRLIVYVGATREEDSTITLQARDASTILMVKGSDKNPLRCVSGSKQIDLDLTWLLQNVSAGNQFAIDRSDPKCKTPVWNDQVQKALAFFALARGFACRVGVFWSSTVEANILSRHSPVTNKPENTPKKPELSTTRSDGQNIVCPVLPLFEDNDAQSDGGGQVQERAGLLALSSSRASGDGAVSTPLLSTRDMDKILGEHARSIKEALDALQPQFNTGDNDGSEGEEPCMVTFVEATSALLSSHMECLAEQYEDSVGFIEDMLRKQLVAAIGKELQPIDFEQFMIFQNRFKLYDPSYAPNPFCFAIRQPGQFPAGLLTIEQQGGDGSKMDPIETFTRKTPASEEYRSIKIPLNAATTLQMTGERFLHGWIRYSFGSGRQSSPPQLGVRARQFSCFLVMVGNMAGPDQFNPKDAIIVQNKDEVLIPLLLDALPSAKEFKDAISSLSPEQQSFARSFRGMQLESSVFGVCVVQLKPQLEDLLVLPRGALTKEMQLTQDLLSLFIDYQIPPDMLSYDGDDDETKTSKIALVKEYTKSVMDVVRHEKNKQMQLGKDRAKLAKREHSQGRRPMTAEERKADAMDDALGWLRNADAGIGELDDSRALSRLLSAAGLGHVSPADQKAKELSDALDWLRKQNAAGADLDDISVASYAKVGSGPRLGSPDESMPPLDDYCSDGFDEPEMLALEADGLAPGFDFSRCVPGSDYCDEVRYDEEGPYFSGDSGHDGAVDNYQQQTARGRKDVADATRAPEQVVDFTQIPKAMDALFQVHDTDGSLRATKIKTSNAWTRKRFATLLSKTCTTSTLNTEDIRSERDKAFDLLDALSRSGTLSLPYSELHVCIAVTHCFENDLMGTVLQDNVNPIEKVEKSSLMVAATIHGLQSPAKLLKKDQGHETRLRGSYPVLMNGVAN